MKKLDYRKKTVKVKKDPEVLKLLGKEVDKYPKHILIDGGISFYY